MPKRFICTLTKNELEKFYHSDGMTLKKMRDVIGCKSEITVAKILKSNGIDTNRNKMVSFAKRGNRTDKEFMEYLVEEYLCKMRSMSDIAKELNISWVIVSRYLSKYNIRKRTKSEQQSGCRSSGWKGGRSVTSHGYVKVFMPDHPYATSSGYVYEHRLAVEKHLGRYLKPNECIHHIDLNKTNNDINNLLILTNSNHAKLHLFLRLWEDAKRG